METENELTKIDVVRRVFLFLNGFLTFQIVALIIQLILINTGKVEPITLENGKITYDFTSFSGMIMFVSYFVGLLISLAILWKEYLYRLFQSFKWKSIRDGLVWGIFVICASSVYSIIASKIGGVTSNDNQVAVDSMVVNSPVLAFFTICIFAPIIEELTYRFALFSTVRRYNKWLAYVVAIFVFAFIHFDFSARGDAMINELLAIPSYMIAAGILALAYDKSGIGASITAHALNNTLSFLITILSIIAKQEG